MTLAQAIEHMNEWATEQALDGPITQAELDGIKLAIEELTRLQETKPAPLPEGSTHAL